MPELSDLFPLAITSAVAELASDSDHELHLANGEVVKGGLSTVGKNKVQVADSGNRTETLISLDQIQSIDPPVAEPIRWQGDITLGGTMTGSHNECRATLPSAARASASETELPCSCAIATAKWMSSER